MPSAGVKRDNATEEVFYFRLAAVIFRLGWNPEGDELPSGSVLSRIAKLISSAAPLPDPGREN
jgi:hypothetical protein